jgi:hydroxymethylglutaryl-CoA reductase
MKIHDRIDSLTERNWLDPATAERLKNNGTVLPAELADKMIENVVGVFGLPLAVAPNFRINGRDYVVPMVVEEPSIVAAVSGAARIVRDSGGFAVVADDPLLVGQILLTGVADIDMASRELAKHRSELVSLANRVQPNLKVRGGGARELEVHNIALPSVNEAASQPALVLHLLVDTRDAMGANLVNSMCEGIAPRIEALASGTALLKIVSNLADRSLVTARATIRIADLASHGRTAESVRDAIILANDFAWADRHRAATHNKGIMNGIDAVAIATGNDWRSIEAGAHAYAARDGAYRSLTRWFSDADGNLCGELVVPLRVGIVGASLQANPAVQVGLQIAGAGSAAELACVMGAVGLAQNFAALRALVTEGIQKGHMTLHARSVAASAGTPQRHFATVVEGLIASGDIKVRKARELLAGVEEGNDRCEPHTSGAAVEVHGEAAGKVILFGEHAAVYGRHVLALPLASSVTAFLREREGATTVTLIEPGIAGTTACPLVPAALHELVDLVTRQLGLEGRHFEIRLHSRIPRAAGLGSSAAVAVALLRAFSKVFDLRLSNEDVNSLAFECEKLAHGNPSGIDNTVATYGQAILYRRDEARAAQPLALSRFPPLVIAASGVRSTTREQVAAVQERRAAMTERYDAIFDEIGRMSVAGAAALTRDDYADLGLLMNLCHGLLNAIGVSTPELERMVCIARNNGALGAKLTGAGGGGSIVAICPDTQDRVERALIAAGYRTVRLANG